MTAGSGSWHGERRGWGLGPHAAAASGAVVVALAVAVGAFGTHTLGDVLSPARLDTLETAVRYQFIGGLGLLLVAALTLARGAAGTGLMRVAAALLLLGTAIFCGTLYGLVAGGPGWLGALTPLGGFALICGWLTVAAAFVRR